jgi:uncharacterized coiled-coil protein SlyX
MLELAIALVVLGALAWDGWRRFVVVRTAQTTARIVALESRVARMERETAALVEAQAAVARLEERVRDLGNKLAMTSRGRA